MGWIGGVANQKVAVEKVSLRTIVETVSASGKIQPEIEVKISSDVSGEIVSLMVKEGQKVSFIFDGFPAILFSGWPKASVGIFRGQILFIEKSIQENGKYRILVTPDNSSKAWPQMLAIGTGASAVALLNEICSHL
jgi:hypothetical protein